MGRTRNPLMPQGWMSEGSEELDRPERRGLKLFLFSLHCKGVLLSPRLAHSAHMEGDGSRML